MNKTEQYIAAKIEPLLSNREHLRQWLLSKGNLDAIVGVGANAYDCPVYHFLAESGIPVAEVTFGHVDIRVSSDGRYLALLGCDKEGVDMDNMPYWVSDLVVLIDKFHPRTGTNYQDVSVRFLLAALNALDDRFYPEDIDGTVMNRYLEAVECL